MKNECEICGKKTNSKESGRLSLDYITYSKDRKKQTHGTWSESVCIGCCKKIHNYVRVISKER
jgi:hypothetical protein